MDVTCGAEPCPVILNATCVFYEGDSLIYTGIVNNDNLETALQKIDAKFQDSAIGYIFDNGIIQLNPGEPVKLGGNLIENTTIVSNGFTFNLTGTFESAAFITTGGLSSEFVKGDGSLDTTAYQPVGNYITDLYGDGTASGPGNSLFTLSNSGVIANTYGSSTQVPIVTVDAKGRITNLTTTLISIPSALLFFTGDVTGAGSSGSPVTLTLLTVNPDVFTSDTFLKFSVNGKGLVTSASPVTGGDISSALGYVPVPNTRTLTINGVSYNLTANRTWNVGTVTSVGLVMPFAFNVSPATITTNGTFVVSAVGTADQFIRGDGTLGNTAAFTAGTAGTSGSSGSNGFGTSGTSGVGSPGTSGTSGADGATGTSGVDGTSGTSGVGSPGTSGTSATAGSSGSSGSSSSSGSAGTSGLSGTSGTSGTSGSSGVSGTSGTSGTRGTSGSSSTSGSSGTSSTSGSTGTSGSSGTTGSSGSSATSGSSGSSGISSDPLNLVTVGLVGSFGVDFNSIKAAVDSITTATSTSPWTVKVFPGLYIEDTITMKSWISVKGESHTTTIVEASNVNNSVFIMADQSLVIDVQIQGSTGTGAAAVVYSSPTTPQTNAIAYIENVRFGANYTHAKTIGVTGGNCILQCSNVKYGGYPFTIGFHVTNAGSGGIGRMQLRNVTSTNGGVVTTTGLIFALADQPSCTFIVNGCLLTKASGVAGGTGFWVENGASLRLTALNFQRWATAIYAPNTGSAPSIFGSALNFENNTKDVVVEHPTATGHIEGTDTFLKTEIPIPAPLYQVNTDPRMITVGTKGSNFTSIKAAVDWITGSAANNRFVVQVGPGQFFENEIDLTGKPYVSIVGSNIQTTQIFPNTATQHIIKIGKNNEISFLSLGDSGPGYAAVYCDDIGDFAQAHKISFYNCDIGVWIKSSTQDTVFFGEYMDMNEVFSYGVKVEATNGFLATANLENYYLFPLGAGAVIGTYATGLGAELSIYTSSFAGEATSGSVCIQMEDGANLEASGLDIPDWDYGIQVLNVGVASTFKIVGSMIHDSTTYDFDILHPTCIGRFQGVSDHSKINNASSDFYWNFLDDNDGENDITRKLSVTFADNTHTDASTLIFNGSPMGVMSGGAITIVSGLTIQTAAGYGYLQKTITPDVYKRIDWVNSSITLSANTNNYIYINDNEILSASGTQPSSVDNIILGRVVTNATGVELIDATPFYAAHMSNSLSVFNRNALGAVYASGSSVAENATAFRLNVGSGDYYFSENNFLPSGGTAITFTQYYRDGGTGWTRSSTNTVNNTQYDNGTGTLASLTSMYYVKHTLYVVGQGADEEYFLVLGQAQYSSLVLAEGASLPTPPTYFTDGVVSIASIYIQQGAANIIEIQDVRPVIGFKASGVSATAVHGNLLGLAADDHTQYLLVDGTRQMSADLGLGGNDLYNINTITTSGLADVNTLKVSGITNDNAQTRYVVVDSAGNAYYSTAIIAGSSGTSGVNSTSGTSGTRGSSGSSGSSSSSGSSGSSSSSGSSGTSGINGTSGTSGSAGSSGIAGTSGTSGTRGTSGSSGSSGSSGTSGVNGTSGTSGTSGSSGSSASSGSSGISGTVGTSGISGLDGALSGRWKYTISSVSSGFFYGYLQSGFLYFEVNNIDFDGNDFNNNFNYLISLSATRKIYLQVTDPITKSIITFDEIGLTDGIFANAVQLDTKNTTVLPSFPIGDIMFSFSVGGANGTSGTSGSSGVSGTSGTSGTRGTSGSSGSSGSSGFNGTSGTSGSSGLNGSSGTSGINGSSGTSASSGTSGQNGNTGTSGTSGSSGSSGIAGTSGSAGSAGSSGVSGNGTAGTSGVNATPGGGNLHVQYNNAGTFDGAAYVNIQNGYLSLLDSAVTPPTPAASNLVLFTRDRSNRLLPAFVGPSGLDTTLQPALFGNTTFMWFPGVGTTLAINWGSSFTARNNGTNALQAHPTKASTNAITSLNRATFSTGTTATGASGIQTSATVAWRGNATGLGGFFFFARFAIETFASDIRSFVGLSANNATLAADPSTWANTVGIGKDTADSTWQIITRSATTLTKTNTAITVNATDILDFFMFTTPAGSSVTFSVRNALTGEVLFADTTLTANLPAITTFMYMQAHIGSVSGITAKLLALNRMYTEIDL